MKILTHVLAQIAFRSALFSPHVLVARIALVSLISSAATATTYDANSLTISSSSGDGVTAISVSGASGGNIRVFNSDAEGDFIVFNLSVPATGEYALSVRYYKNPNRGTVRLSIAGNEQGTVIDGYDPVGAFASVDYGKVLLNSGTNQIKFSLTGHNASSSSYRIGLDTITLDTAPARTDITTFATIADALNSGVPLYAPPGTYNLPPNFTPSTSIDILGSMDTNNPSVFNLVNPTFLPASYSFRFQGIRFFGYSGPGAKLLAILSQSFTIPNFTVYDCEFDQCTPMDWPTFPSITGQIVQRLEMRRFTIDSANRGLFAGGRIDDYDITDFTVDSCGRFGVCIGPAGTGITDTIESFMRRGMVARGTISGTSMNTPYNRNQLAITGNHVVVQDMDLLNMVLPANYYTDPALLTDYPTDSEPFYTKVEDLVVKNLYIENDGAKQAMWGNKGASEYDKSPISPEGRDSRADTVTFVNTGSRYAVGIWHQAHGDNVFKNVTMHNRTRDAVIIQNDSATGTVTIENWVDVNPPSATAYPGVKNKSLNNVPPAPAPVDVTLINSPTLTEYQP